MDVGITTDPDLLDRASVWFMAGQMVEAEHLCQQVLRRQPDHPDALRQLGLVRLVGGDPASALAILLPLQSVFVKDPDLAIALAEAAWATQSAAEAVPHYRRALGLVPGRARVRVRFGMALLTAGQPSEARQELELAATVQPDGLTLSYLGMALLGEGRAADAIPVLQRAAQMEPDNPTSPFHLGQSLRDMGRIDEAIPALAEAVRRAPGQAHLRVALGDALFARGDRAAGKAELVEAATLDPSQPMTWARLGDMEQLSGETARSLACYQRAVALDGDDAELRVLLGNALLAAGDAAASTRELGRSMVAGWNTPSQPGARLRVGILAAPGGANTPTSFILDRRRFAVSPLFMLDGLDYPTDRITASYDVLFNAISDPDAAPGALALGDRLVPAFGLPVVNPPSAMPGTVRELMAMRLTGIEGLHVPRTVRVKRLELAQSTPVPFDGPTLVRPTGSHGGRDTVLAQTTGDVRQAAADLACDEVYLTEFADFRSDGGLYRKLRLVFVGGQAFPVHLAIGEHWLSHYFRTTMAEMPGWRSEEAAFLGGFEAYLGPAICRALTELQARVGLDFFGVDAAVGPDGRLVVFECNASMLVRHVDRPAMFDYKNAPAERIRSAVGDLLHRFAGRTQETNPSR
jgi:tetratricopeptide (TPR) repeat protein/glutathione synthase/RimK-type ligase-like ATP-grasp enzyme